jgi:hypothetical protein
MAMRDMPFIVALSFRLRKAEIASQVYILEYPGYGTAWGYRRRKISWPPPSGGDDLFKQETILLGESQDGRRFVK